MSDDLLKEAQEWAELFFTNDELAMLLEVPAAEIRLALDDSSSPLGSAIMRGRLLSEAELRKSIILLAKRGSSPAQATALQLLQRMHSNT
jgi:hypothetical protein